MSLSLSQGTTLVNSARAIIASQLGGKKSILPKDAWLSERFGIFATLHTYPEHELRGCIGFIEPRFALKDAIHRAAIAAAFEDPRFPPIEKPELSGVIIEVSVLTKPEKLNATGEKEILAAITPKIDGVILENGHSSGLFLPQVWDELPDKSEFLENLCYKAGLSDARAWCKSGTCLYTFRVQAFEEERPGGHVVERKNSC